MSLLFIALWIFSFSLQGVLCSSPFLCCEGDAYLEVRDKQENHPDRFYSQVQSGKCLQSQSSEKVLNFTKLDFVNISGNTEHLVISRNSNQSLRWDRSSCSRFNTEWSTLIGRDTVSWLDEIVTWSAPRLPNNTRGRHLMLSNTYFRL